MGEVVSATAVTILTIIGSICVGLWFMDWITDKFAEFKRHKLCRKRQRERLKMYEAGDFRAAPIIIAQEWAAELESKERPALPEPVRKVTGLLSGPDALELWEK